MQAPHNTPSSAVFLNNQRGDFSGCLWLFTKDTYSHLFSSTSFQKILSRSFFRASTSQCHFGARLRVVCVSPTTYNTTRRQERILRAHTQTRGDGRVSSHRKEREKKKSAELGREAQVIQRLQFQAAISRILPSTTAVVGYAIPVS